MNGIFIPYSRGGRAVVRPQAIVSVRLVRLSDGSHEWKITTQRSRHFTRSLRAAMNCLRAMGPKRIRVGDAWLLPNGLVEVLTDKGRFVAKMRRDDIFFSDEALFERLMKEAGR